MLKGAPVAGAPSYLPTIYTAYPPIRLSIYNRIRHYVLHGIDRLPIHPHLVVQVGAGGEPRRADERDLLAALHALAPHHEDLRAVRVARHEPEAVVEGEHVAVALFPPDVGHDAGRGRFDLRPHRRADVDALVRAREGIDVSAPMGA